VVKGHSPVDTAKWLINFCHMPATSYAKLPYRDNLQMAKIVHLGLPASALNEMARMLNVAPRAFLAVVKIAPRTLARRRERLKADESERVLRVARLFRLAEDVFEGRSAAVRWFSRPLQALGGRSPLALCSTEFGAKEVEQTLGRIEHGVFS
jgi:putative toxin-antitoxin system antitoxin component (TIGR02293 family)